LICAIRSKTQGNWFSWPNNPSGLDYSINVRDGRTSTHGGSRTTYRKECDGY